MSWNENSSKILTNRGKGKKRVDVQPRSLWKLVSPDLESCVPHCAFSASFHLSRPIVQCFECISTSPFQLLPYMWLGKWYRMVNVDFARVKCRCREWSDGLKPRPHWLHPPPFHLSNLTHNNGQVCEKNEDEMTQGKSLLPPIPWLVRYGEGLALARRWAEIRRASVFATLELHNYFRLRHNVCRLKTWWPVLCPSYLPSTSILYSFVFLNTKKERKKQIQFNSFGPLRQAHFLHLAAALLFLSRPLCSPISNHLSPWMLGPAAIPAVGIVLVLFAPGPK